MKLDRKICVGDTVYLRINKKKGLVVSRVSARKCSIEGLDIDICRYTGKHIRLIGQQENNKDFDVVRIDYTGAPVKIKVEIKGIMDLGRDFGVDPLNDREGTLVKNRKN